jgi:hypothetical protein
MTREGVTMTPKEVAEIIRRSPKWVATQCRLGRFPTLPPHRRPYLIPRSALFPGSELVASPGK